MDSHEWTCAACGQRILRARDGWLSLTDDGCNLHAHLVHHLSASPWSHWGGCYPSDEVASLHLPDVSETARDDELVAAALASLQEHGLALHGEVAMR